MEHDQKWLHEHWPRLSAGVALAVLASWLFVERYRLLTGSPFPLGIDGYYYPVQLRSLLHTAGLYYPSAPLGLWLMAPFAAFTDPITGAKLAAATASAAAVFPTYLLAKQLSGDRLAALLAAFILGTSAGWTYLSLEFVKTAIGLSLATAYLVTLLWALDAPTRKRLLAAAAVLGLVLLSHKLAFTVAVLLSVAPVCVAVRPRWRERPRLRRHIGITALATGSMVVALGVLAPSRFVGAGDLSHVVRLVTDAPSWLLPIADARRGRPLYLTYEVLTMAALCALALAIAIAKRRSTAPVSTHVRMMTAGVAILGLLIALPWLNVSDPEGLGVRVRLVAILPLAAAAAVVLARATRRRSDTTRGLLVAVCCVAWFATRPLEVRGLVAVSPDMVAAIRELDVPDDAVVIASDRRAMYMIAWYTKHHARLRPDGVVAERRWRLLHTAALRPSVRAAIARMRQDPPEPTPTVTWLGRDPSARLVLIHEAAWQRLMSAVPPRVRRFYARWDFR